MWMWLHHIVNPHCNECIREREMMIQCESCETLHEQLGIANREKDILLKKILELTSSKLNIPESEHVPANANPQPLFNRSIPWKIRQQALEAEDREKAKLMRATPRPMTTDEFEKHVSKAEEDRNAESSKDGSISKLV